MFIKRPITHISIVLALIITLICPFSARSDDFYPAKVKDVSDRGYEAAVIDLLDNATESIVISMYIMSPAEKGPVAFLINDLIEALDRGVSVVIYLNTKFSQRHTEPSFSEKPFQLLREKGAVIRPVSNTYMLHDKLIIVDSRYVVEGSANWSISAMKNNFESTTLIDSPELAGEKLERLKRLPLESERIARIENIQAFKEAYSSPIEGAVKVNASLLEDKNLLPRMVRYQDDRTMNAYLLLLARGQNPPEGVTKGVSPVFLVDMASELSMPEGWSDQYKRIAVTKILRKLQDKYGLIDVTVQYGKEAQVTLKELEGASFSVKGEFFNPEYLSSTRSRTKYVYLIKALLQEEGTSIDSFTREEISRRFHIGIRGLRLGIRELEGKGNKDSLGDRLEGCSVSCAASLDSQTV